MKEKKTYKKDLKTNHKYNFLVCFSNSHSETKKALVNASDKKNAMRIAFNRLCRLYPFEEVSRARIGGVYLAKEKRIEKRIG